MLATAMSRGHWSKMERVNGGGLRHQILIGICNQRTLARRFGFGQALDIRLYSDPAKVGQTSSEKGGMVAFDVSVGRFSH